MSSIPSPQQQRRVSFADQQQLGLQQLTLDFPSSASLPTMEHASVFVSQGSRDHDHEDTTVLVMGEPQPWYLKRLVYFRVLVASCILATAAVVALVVILLVLIQVGNHPKMPPQHDNSSSNINNQTNSTAQNVVARRGILWEKEHVLHGRAPGDKFGYSVATSSYDMDAIYRTATNRNSNNQSNGQQSSLPKYAHYWVTGAPFCEASDGTTNVGCVDVFQWTENGAYGSTANASNDSSVINISLDQHKRSALHGDLAISTLGWSVAVAVDQAKGSLIVATGAPQNSIFGFVRVYEYSLTASSSSSWRQIGQDLVGVSLPGNLGNNVALSADGRILAVACDEYSLGEAGYYGGQVQVYCYGCETSNKTIPLWAPMGSSLLGRRNGDLFGYSMALSSNGLVLAVGSVGYSRNVSKQGQVQVFAYNGSDWELLGDSLNGENGFFLLGSSVALSSDGTILATGAISWASSTGLVRVYRFDSSTNKWMRMGSDLVGTSENDFFGTAVSLSTNGTILAVAADQHWYSSSRQGYARVFEYDATAADWEQIGQDLVGSAGSDNSNVEVGEQFGTSVALTGDGKFVLVGAPYPTSMNASGSVFVFRATQVE